MGRSLAVEEEVSVVGIDAAAGPRPAHILLQDANAMEMQRPAPRRQHSVRSRKSSSDVGEGDVLNMRSVSRATASACSVAIVTPSTKRQTASRRDQGLIGQQGSGKFMISFYSFRLCSCPWLVACGAVLPSLVPTAGPVSETWGHEAHGGGHLSGSGNRWAEREEKVETGTHRPFFPQ